MLLPSWTVRTPRGEYRPVVSLSGPLLGESERERARAIWFWARHEVVSLDAEALRAARSLLAEISGMPDTYRPWDISSRMAEQMADELEWAVLTGRIRFEEIRTPLAPLSPDTQKPEEAAPPPAVADEELSLSNPRWEHVDTNRRRESPDAVLFGDEIVLRVDVQGAHQGAKVSFEVLDQTTEKPTRIATLSGPNDGGSAQALWRARDLAARRELPAGPRATFTATLRGKKTEDCAIPYLVERGRLHVLVRSLHLERPWGKQDIVIAGGDLEVEGTLDDNGLFEHPDEIPFGEYQLTIGEFTTKVLAVREGDPPFVVPVPPEAFPDARWREEDMAQEGDQFD